DDDHDDDDSDTAELLSGKKKTPPFWTFEYYQTFFDIDTAQFLRQILHPVILSCPKYYPSRQSLRLEPRGKSIKDELRLSDLDLPEENKLYFKDLGPQIRWSTVFLTEYSGPLFVYLLFVPRPAFIYGIQASLKPRASVVWIAAEICLRPYGNCLILTGILAKLNFRLRKRRWGAVYMFTLCIYDWALSDHINLIVYIIILDILTWDKYFSIVQMILLVKGNFVWVGLWSNNPPIALIVSRLIRGA
ncbi:very-long-chain enoyl- reductase-like, partial [Paramuricea clavata]